MTAKNTVEKGGGSYDAIVVGSGAGGGTAAWCLAGKCNLRVLVLEKGPRRKTEDFLPYDELHYLEHRALTPSVKTDPNIYVDPVDGKPRPVHRWWISNMVGGSTMIWEANLPRYTSEDLAPMGFATDLWGGASMVDWPWTYEEFQPFFEMAEHEWGVSGRANQSRMQEPTRPGYEFPMPPLRPHASTPFLMRAFGKFGMSPYMSPRGINSRTYDSRPGCPFCGYCQGFGCAVNDRCSSTNTVLSRAMRTGRCDLLTGHCVTRILHENGSVVGVAYKTDPQGPERVFKAPLVFVSIQAIESARLFLISEIPDPNKLIGRYLTYHTKGTVEMTFKGQPVWDEGPDRVFQPRTSLGTLQLRDLYVIRDPKRKELKKGGKFSIYDPATINPPIKMLTRTGYRNDLDKARSKEKNIWGMSLIDRLLELRNQGGVEFSFTGETMSVYDNRVELDEGQKDPWGLPAARVYYKHHPYDMALSEYCLNRMVEVMSASGGELRKFEPQREANEGYGHNHGTLRAGKDPGTSVLDSSCQCHTVKGLRVLDSAFMPTAGASNPTLTQIANAYRVCLSL